MTTMMKRMTLVCAVWLMITAPAFAVTAASSASSATPVTGGFEYSYSITNDATSPANIVAWGIPFFDDAATVFLGGDESSIVTPDGWTHLFVETTGSSALLAWDYLAADDPKRDTYGAPGSAFETAPYALVFLIDFDAFILDQSIAIAPGEELVGFGYASPFAGTNIPFLAAYDNVSIAIGDPLGPISPNFPVTTRQDNGIPEPASILLALSGLTLLVRRPRQERM